MEDFVDEGGKNIRTEKRHIQDECDLSDNSPPKLRTTPRRSRGKTSVESKPAARTRSDKVSVHEISEGKTRSSSRTPAEKRSARKTRPSNRSPVEKRSTCKTDSSNRTPLEKSARKIRSSRKTSDEERSASKTRSSRKTAVEERSASKTRSSRKTQVEERSASKTRSSRKTRVEERSASKTRSSRKTAVEERSASKTRSSYRSPALEKRTSKTRLFNRTPEHDINTSKREVLNRPALQEKRSSKRRSSNRSPIQEERTIKIRCSNVTPEPKMDIGKSSSSGKTPLQENITSAIKTSCRTPLQERSPRNLMLSDRPLAQCKSGTETRSSDKTPLNGRIVKASRVPLDDSLTAKENESHDNELKIELKQEEHKERKRRQVVQEQNIREHQRDKNRKEAIKNHPPDRESSLQDEGIIRTSDDSGADSPVDSLASDIDKDIQVEVEKVKRRRSTISRRTMSSYSIGGRQSLCTTLSLLSLEDRISKIDEKLPWASKVSKLVDISIRETLQRLEARLPGNECVTDLRVDLLTKFENLAGQVAYKIADYPLVLETALPNTLSHMEEVKASTNRIAAYKKKTEELEKEYRSWKIFLQERKLSCKTAEREFREAKSGEKKIEDDQINQLTSVQRNVISSCPNYHHYIQEIKMVRENAVFMFRDVRLVTNAVSSLITASRLLGESCYAAVEEMSFGYLEKQPTKTNLTSLLQRSHTVASEP